jgi:pyruvate dehydrogenase E2 component (dihydrolipoamide acetyltransferase)
VLVKVGDKIQVGAPVLKLKGADKQEAPDAKPMAVPAHDRAPSPAAVAKQEPDTSRAPERKQGAVPSGGGTPLSPPPGPRSPKKSEEPSAARASAGSTEFKLPALGEGIEGGTVTELRVKPGDAIKAGQNLLVIETDKAAVEVPADADGTVEAVHVKVGDKVKIGGSLLTLKTSGAAPSQPAAARKPAEAAPQEPSRPPLSRIGPLPTEPAGNGAATATTTTAATKTLVPAGPATRRLARELGVALAEVKPSGRGGRVTLDDVKNFVKAERQRAKESGGAALAGGIVVNAFTLPPLPDFAKFGPVEVKEVTTLRQTIAKNLTVGWRTMPMVTQHDLADITELEAGRKRIVEAMPKGSPKITMTVLAIKACVAALKEFPNFNSSYDMNAGKLILKKYFHIGIAVDTDRGLVVPVIRDADKKSIRDLAGEVATLAEKARANKLVIDEMRGGTFTITNLGGIGGTAFTPIVNYPEVAILGLSRSALQPVVKDGQIVPRLMMPLSLTYDHRVIDGADGCRFTVRLVQLFSDPLRLLMET